MRSERHTATVLLKIQAVFLPVTIGCDSGGKRVDKRSLPLYDAQKAGSARYLNRLIEQDEHHGNDTMAARSQCPHHPAVMPDVPGQPHPWNNEYTVSVSTRYIETT